MTDHYSDARERHYEERDRKRAKQLGLKYEELPLFDRFVVAKAIYDKRKHEDMEIEFYKRFEDKFRGHV